MPVKFECPKCGRRFTEWGAEKNGLKCPDDEWCTHPGEEVELVRVGAQAEKPGKKTSLKRTPAKKAAPKPKKVPLVVEGEDEILAADGATASADDGDDDIISDDEDVDDADKDTADIDDSDEADDSKSPALADDEEDSEDDTDEEEETELELGETPLTPSAGKD